jgi:hypothetical protein
MEDLIMSYDLCKRITLDKKHNKIKVCVASNNIRPITYRTYEYCKEDTNYTFNDKLICLYRSMQSGDLQISTINKNTEDFEYAMCKVREYHRANNIDSFKDLYEKKSEVYFNKIYDYSKIKRSQNETQWIRESDDLESYNHWKVSQDKRTVEEMEDKASLEAIWEVYGDSFKVWKQALEEKFEGNYNVIFSNMYNVCKLGKYNRGYSKFSYGGYNPLSLSYKNAYILKYDMSERDLKIVQEGV